MVWLAQCTRTPATLDAFREKPTRIPHVQVRCLLCSYHIQHARLKERHWKTNQILCSERRGGVSTKPVPFHKGFHIWWRILSYYPIQGIHTSGTNFSFDFNHELHLSCKKSEAPINVVSHSLIGSSTQQKVWRKKEYNYQTHSKW